MNQRAICAVIFAVAMGLGPAARLANGASLVMWVLATIAMVAGADFGLLFFADSPKGVRTP